MRNLRELREDALPGEQAAMKDTPAESLANLNS